MSRRRAPVLHSLPVWVGKEDQRTECTRVPDEDGRGEEREDRCRGGRRGEAFHRCGDKRAPWGGPGENRRSAQGARSFETSVTQAEEARDDERDYLSEGMLTEGQEYGEFQ